MPIFFFFKLASKKMFFPFEHQKCASSSHPVTIQTRDTSAVCHVTASYCLNATASCLFTRRPKITATLHELVLSSLLTPGGNIRQVSNVRQRWEKEKVKRDCHSGVFRLETLNDKQRLSRVDHYETLTIVVSINKLHWN